jgi:hypothetical protein
MKRRRRGVGRPEMPPAKRRRCLVTIRFTPAELKRLKAMAKAERLTVAKLIRQWGGFERDEI